MSPSESDVAQRLLQEQYTELATLAGGLAHEIKNPLSTLNLNLQLLAEDFATAESQKERRALAKIEVLQKECQRLEDILNDFLRFARASELHRQPTDLSALARDVVAFQEPGIKAAGLVLRTNLPEGLPQASLDADLIRQALLNLLLNAEQATPEGGELLVQTRAAGNWVYLAVIDTGAGMSPETLSKVFRPFFSTRKGGSGLGLPTTKRIVEAHGGQLNVESAVGKGTAFTIQLPIDA